MMVEYVLLLTILSTLVFTLFTAGNGAFNKTFNESAPRLGARVEKLIRTGEGFAKASEKSNWKIK
jgi:hypothetical protein